MNEIYIVSLDLAAFGVDHIQFIILQIAKLSLAQFAFFL